MNRHRMAMLAINGMVLSCVAAAPILAQTPLGTAFTYQGHLTEDGASANGTYDLRFMLYDADVGGSQVGPIVTRDDATVTDGSFTVSLDFGAVFNGNKRFLEIAVRPGASSGSYTTLSGRQELTPAPNAVFSQSAATAPWSGLIGVPAGFADDTDNDRLSAMACAIGQIPKRSVLGWECAVDTDTNSGGTVTSIRAGTGLTGGTITTSGTIGVSFGTSGTTVAAGDHNHFGQSWTGTGDGLTVTSNLEGGFGVYGLALATSGINYGVRGVTDSSAGSGVYGWAYASTGENHGVYGVTSSSSTHAAGVYGLATAASGQIYGVHGRTNSTSGYGILGYATATSGHSDGVLGMTYASEGGSGVEGWARATQGGTGVHGIADYPDSYAGYFSGKVHVTGNLSKGGGAFKIDHPLDPENKYLHHSFVESPDMMNIYNGNVTTDASGYATVEMPEWFEALNRDFRYQLTVIDAGDTDAFVQAKVVQKIANNRFAIRSSAPQTEVSWQVTGIRKDAWAEAHRIKVEEDKNGDEKGTYLHPDVFGQPKEMGLDYKRRPREVDRPDLRGAEKPPQE